MSVQQSLHPAVRHGDERLPRRPRPSWLRPFAAAVAVRHAPDCTGAGANVAHEASWHLREADGARTLVVPDGRAVSLAVARGRLWLTMDGQAPDRVLEAGQSLRMDGPARLRLGALDLAAPDGAPPAGCLLRLCWLD